VVASGSDACGKRLNLGHFAADSPVAALSVGASGAMRRRAARAVERGRRMAGAGGFLT